MRWTGRCTVCQGALPRRLQILCEAPFTHAVRNRIYTHGGASRSLMDPSSSDPYEFELVNTHPLLKVHPRSGHIEQIVQSETKWGVCAFDFNSYEAIMDAYAVWTELCEDDRFVKTFQWPEHTMLAMSNWKILHGRATVPPETDRTICFGYTSKAISEMRYRLLKFKQRQADDLPEEWWIRNSNQVVQYLIS